MRTIVVEVLVGLVELVAYVAGAVGLTALGILSEQSALQTVGAGDTLLGVWLVVVGAVALAGAYLLTTDRLIPHVRDLVA